MQIHLISCCKTRDKNLKGIEEEYVKRFPKSFPVSLTELGGEKYLKHSAREQQESHSALFQDRCPPQSYRVLLDETGQSFSSQKFAKFLEKKRDSSLQSLVFGIGGPEGWTEQAKQEGDLLLSLSPMTLPYQLARVFLVEQLYRAFTLIFHVPYHR